MRTVYAWVAGSSSVWSGRAAEAIGHSGGKAPPLRAIPDPPIWVAEWLQNGA